MDESKKPEKTTVTKSQSLSRCPHCGVKLSSWEQVLLNVDRVLLCKNCWYRIILDVGKEGKIENNKSEE
jgi:DNA-directed RNA polymerase subunit RPC12/RpoP